jgi:hypothetical protein
MPQTTETVKDKRVGKERRNRITEVKKTQKTERNIINVKRNRKLRTRARKERILNGTERV